MAQQPYLRMSRISARQETHNRWMRVAPISLLSNNQHRCSGGQKNSSTIGGCLSTDQASTMRSRPQHLPATAKTARRFFSSQPPGGGSGGSGGGKQLPPWMTQPGGGKHGHYLDQYTTDLTAMAADNKLVRSLPALEDSQQLEDTVTIQSPSFLTLRVLSHNITNRIPLSVVTRRFDGACKFSRVVPRTIPS